jgi:drug/metabolite transporter (DMT)-like permease
LGITLGLTAAVCWGLADFLARFAARRVGGYRTSFFMQFFGFVGLTVFLVLTGGLGQLTAGAAAGWHPWAWGILTGVLNAGCSLAFYHSLETGALSIVAPISSSYPALTLVLAMMSGEHVSAPRVVGILVTLAGVVLASTSTVSAGAPAQATAGIADERSGLPTPHPRHELSRGVGWAIGASVGFGVMFWLLGFRVMPVLGGYASVWVIRLTTFCVLALAAAPARQSVSLPHGAVWWFLAGVGLLDTSAFLANNLGLKTGHVAVVTVLASLFGAVTVLLAWIFLREKLQRSQWLGIFLIFVGVVLIST